MKHNATQRNATQRNQRNATQRNATQRNATQQYACIKILRQVPPCILEVHYEYTNPIPTEKRNSFL
ncbi:Uncharacterised protein [Escherichia coli]|uniref:Uncharacterized protein n=1 Tax=Escherichia coli TaxID=562 RepID=A0A377D818_ECOLX|nr:Uncharacterised protein [Escherichia coli]